ncbi:hypothetical protein SAMN05421639_102154 [Chryseobacterium shigense]|uniref:Uncharacterized protein n=1 Tax=Chryseobacterium shigense TaxID=297244 RepID=A0A1N7I5G4_9FLAO|nr:hypothetical protein SAMN05421639_102154 [Chryseobacterium shigense]
MPQFVYSIAERFITIEEQETLFPTSNSHLPLSLSDSKMIKIIPCRATRNP